LSTSWLLMNWYLPFLLFLNRDVDGNATMQTHTEFRAKFRFYHILFVK